MMNIKYFFGPYLPMIAFFGNNLLAMDEPKPKPSINTETRISLFLVGNLVSIYDDLNMDSKLKTEENVYQIFFTYYMTVNFFNEKDNPQIRNGLGEVFSKVKDSKTFLTMIEKPNRFFNNEGNFMSNVISFRMNDGSLKEIKIASREEFERINGGFKKFLISLAKP
jgi:hypothetical protein